MTALAEPRPRDWWATVVRVALLVAVLVAAGILLPWWAPVAAALIGVSLVRWHANTYGYRCSNCGATFVVSTVQDALALSGFRKSHPVRRVRCPSCRTRAFMRVLVRRRDD